MKQIVTLLVFLLPLIANSQTNSMSDKESMSEPKMKVGMVIYSNDAETVWNAFRFGNFAIAEGDSVKVFLLAKGVESESLNSDKFNVKEQIRRFVEDGGKIFACGTCLTIRNKEGSEICPLSTMQDLYDIVKWSDKMITF
jgi:uncharacterized protein involved in oxidation of intracellular sulfur